MVTEDTIGYSRSYHCCLTMKSVCVDGSQARKRDTRVIHLAVYNASVVRVRFTLVFKKTKTVARPYSDIFQMYLFRFVQYNRMRTRTCPTFQCHRQIVSYLLVRVGIEIFLCKAKTTVTDTYYRGKVSPPISVEILTKCKGSRVKYLYAIGYSGKQTSHRIPFHNLYLPPHTAFSVHVDNRALRKGKGLAIYTEILQHYVFTFCNLYSLRSLSGDYFRTITINDYSGKSF